MADHNYQCHVARLGIPDEFIHHGTQEELYRDCGFDAQGIVEKAMLMLPEVKSSLGEQTIKKSV
jgi:1-deoxy-D-xylulose-5-phosphate synthase